MDAEQPALKKKISIISSIVLVGMAASICFHYILGAYYGKPYPYSTFLFRPDDKFNDFLNMFHITRELSPYNSSHWFNSNYFPFANFFFFLFTLVGSAKISLLVFLGGFLAAHSLAVKKVSGALSDVSFPSLMLLFFFNYPVIFTIDRANLELYILLALALFAFAYRRNDFVPSLALAAAISMKLYPGVLIVLFLRDRRYRAVLLTMVFCAILSFGPLFAFRGGAMENIRQMLGILSAFDNNTAGLHGVQHNATLWGVIKIAKMAQVVLFGDGAMAGVAAFEGAAFKYYAFLVVAAFIAISISIVRRKPSDHDAWAILVGVMILFPGVSYDYKLILLIIPLALFLLRRGARRSDSLIACLYGLLLIPKDYLILRGDVSISSVLNPLLLTVLVAACLFERPGETSRDVLH